MSTLVLARRPARASVRIPGPGLFARILEHLLASRARQADRHIRLYLAQLPDATLDRIGLSPAEITVLRAGRAINTSGLFSRDDGWSRRPHAPSPFPLDGGRAGEGGAARRPWFPAPRTSPDPSSATPAARAIPSPRLGSLAVRVAHHDRC